MGGQMKATDDQVRDAYLRNGSVWKAARELGMAGQTVHERLRRMGVDTHCNVFTAADERYLAERYVPYRDAGQLQALADEMGRTKQFICRKARALGLTDKNRMCPYGSVWKDMPREVVQPIWDDFKRSRRGVKEYCARRHYRQQGFSDCMRRNYPEEYEAVVSSKRPKSTKYRLGRDFEYEVLKDMSAHGFLTLRSPASKSPVDIYCIARGQLVFVQAKRGGAIGVKEWNVFYDFCASVSALPIMAEKVPGGIAYHLLTAKKDGSRSRQPMRDWEPPYVKESES